MGRRVRYFDLRARGIVNNRTTLANWIRKLGFPAGQMTGPNTRTWDEDTEINPWLASRPTASKPLPETKRPRGRPRKQREQVAAAVQSDEIPKGTARP
jgi:hypothetical protein